MNSKPSPVRPANVHGDVAAASEGEADDPVIPSSLVDLFKQFDRVGLRWALLRPWQALSCAEGDVDVLLETRGLAKAREVLLELGFRQMPVPGDDVHAVKLDENLPRFIWVHVQSGVNVAGVRFGAETLLAEVKKGRFPEIADRWMLWILLLRALKNGGFPERYRGRARQLASAWRGGPEQMEALFRQKGLDPQGLIATVASGDWDVLPWFPPEAAEPDTSAQLRRVWRASCKVVATRDRGLLVAVIGPDGAGKSTLVEGLQRTLPVPVRAHYMGLTGGWMHRARALRLPGLVFAAQAAVLWARFVRAALYRAAGHVVLLDRYVLDGAVPAGTPLPLSARVGRRLQRWIVPLPDLVILLDASGATMHGRKGEYYPQTLESWRSAYRRLEASVPCLVILDAEQPAVAVLHQAQALIWRRLQQRWGRPQMS